MLIVWCPGPRREGREGVGRSVIGPIFGVEVAQGLKHETDLLHHVSLLHFHRAFLPTFMALVVDDIWRALCLLLNVMNVLM